MKKKVHPFGNLQLRMAIQNLEKIKDDYEQFNFLDEERLEKTIDMLKKIKKVEIEG